ncbi:PLP-dependent aminotransferase family protein [Eubacterium sp. 1001713B170207_170306_E7]|uniref:aminotransferase-like domain-containing protein n=1 Tax=Eubacterium sp. 1001713B170207_170306_E7 TaxID=2787097 RepID=UPI001897CF96|nr:PLP-dependent aminotransferase family protein [Eubacterium sp. 1001713B170207_170306_E7]
MQKSQTLQTVCLDWQPDKNSGVPLYVQIVRYVSGQVASGHWGVGTRLPSQRRMAQALGVNRSTVVTAMEELAAIGLVEGRGSSGTRIASDTWSLLLSGTAPDWGRYIRSGSFQANQPTVQTINRLEFEDYVRLGTGELSPSLFPGELMSRVLERLSRRTPPLHYLEPLGLPELRQAVSDRLAHQGIAVPPSGILITSGSLQALQLISVGILDPSSRVFAEAPSYLKSLQVFQSAGMSITGIPMDEQGLLYRELERYQKAQGKTSENQLLYTIPSYQNPTGTLMSEERRVGLIAFCQKNRLPVIEDNAYSELWLDSPPPASLKARDKSGMVLSLGTLSKTLAPGLRIGWIAGPESVVRRLGDIKMQTDYGASSLSQWAAAEFLAGGQYDTYLDGLRRALRKRRDAALRALADYFTGLADWNVPEGGFYIWLRFKSPLSIDRLFKKALERRILLNPGSIYDFAPSHALRISYAYEPPEVFREAVKTLAELGRGLDSL